MVLWDPIGLDRIASDHDECYLRSSFVGIDGCSQLINNRVESMISRSSKLPALLLAVGVSFFGINTAHADIIAPDEESCSDKKAGDTCELQGESGKCVEFKRCRATPDGSEDCWDSHRCDTSAAPEAKPDAEEPAKDDGASGDKKEDKEEDKKPEETKPEETEPSEPKAPAEKGSGSCAQSGFAPAGDLIPAASLLAGLCLFGVLRRQRS